MKKVLCVLLTLCMLCGVCAGCGGKSPAGKVEELEQLKGKVVYSIGNGQVPDLVFRYLLKKAGVEYRFGNTAADDVVTLDYVDDGAMFNAGFLAGQYNYGVISEPAATAALKQAAAANIDASRMLDIQTLYEKVTGSDNGYPQAALVVKKSFLAAHPDYVANFVDTFKTTAKWAETEPASALAAIREANSTAVPMLTEEIAKGCNLGFTAAADAKAQLLAFYEGLNSVKKDNETPVGDTLPDDAFFIGDIRRTGSATDAVEAKVYAPDGAPAISLAKMIADGFDGATFEIVQAANIGPTVLSGKADIAIMPTNAAAMLYGKGADIAMLGVTNFGSLYMVGRNA